MRRCISSGSILRTSQHGRGKKVSFTQARYMALRRSVYEDSWAATTARLYYYANCRVVYLLAVSVWIAGGTDGWQVMPGASKRTADAHLHFAPHRTALRRHYTHSLTTNGNNACHAIGDPATSMGGGGLVQLYAAPHHMATSRHGREWPHSRWAQRRTAAGVCEGE